MARIVLDPGMGRANFLACVARTQPRVLVGLARAQFVSWIFRDAFRSVRLRVRVAGELDIAMHRDDIALRGAPVVGPSHVPFDVTGKTIVLVDDVLFTGRSIRAALDEITDFGRPKQIQLAVLIDRGHRDLPIKADFIGKNVPTALDEKISLLLIEAGAAQDEVILKKR